MSAIAKNILFFILSTLAGLAMMGWLYRGFQFEALAHFFTLRSNYLWITITLLAGVTANVLRSMRWRMLLRSAHIEVSLRRAVELVFIAYLINSVTPRLGELTRSLLVKKGDADVSTRALGTVVVEKLADVACLVVVVGLAVALRWHATVELVRNMTAGLEHAVPNYAKYVVAGAAVCLAIGFGLPLRKQLKRFFSNLWQGVSAIVRLHRPLRFIALCVGIWTCNFLQLYLLVPCFAELSHIGFGEMVHVFAAVSVGMLLPTPAGAGPWHFAIVKTLTSAYGIARPISQSFALISHGLKTALVMLLGLLGYASYYRSLFMWWRKHH